MPVVGDDPVIVPVTRTETDENGNTVIVGYPPDGGSSYSGPVSTTEEVTPNFSPFG